MALQKLGTLGSGEILLSARYLVGEHEPETPSGVDEGKAILQGLVGDVFT